MAKFPQNSNHTPIRVNNRVIGYVRGGVFRKKVSGSIHKLRSPAAWAFEASSLRDASRAGAETVEIHDTEKRRRYRASMSTIREHGVAFNRGYGDQIFLTLKHWTDPTAATQSSLFEFAEVCA